MSDDTAKTASAAGNADHSNKMKQAVDKLLSRAPAVSEGSVHLGGRGAPLRYDARCEFLPVLSSGFEGAAGEPQAAVMVTSYQLKRDRGVERPVCFAFNGGPGSASIWLHLGALGPKRVVVPDDGSMPLPPYGVEDNPHSWFEHFDLVFIDPPHTGWSITASKAARKRMLGVDGDVEALTEVVRQWLTRHQRWGSPV